MSELSVNRTLVKSPPELWTELSEVERLAEHLGEFGQIRITKVEPEKTVAWEGEHGSGTVEIAASGWGTKVTLTAALSEVEAAQEPEAEPAPEAEQGTEAAHEPTPQVPPVASGNAPPPPATARSHWDPTPAPPRAAESHWSPAPPPRRESPRRGRLARFFGRRSSEPRRHAWQEPVGQPPPAAPAWQPPPPPAPPAPQPSLRPEPAPQPRAARPDPEPPPPEPETAPEPRLDPERALAALEGALDTLGSAHHRPFSRG